MAVHIAGRYYNNLSLDDIFRQSITTSRDNELTEDLIPNSWNECQFAVPPGVDVSLFPVLWSMNC